MYDLDTSDLHHDVDTNIRAGDSDREATAERLRRHHAEGRIDMDEFQQRLDRCYQARTAGELRELVADLPPDRQHVPRHLGRRRLIPLVAILVTILAVTAVTGDGPNGFLFLFLAFPLVRLLLGRGRRWNMRGRPASA